MELVPCATSAPLWQGGDSPSWGPRARPYPEPVATSGRNLARDLGIGLAGGILSGIFGIAGGVVVVPMLVLIVHLAQRRAQATSLVMIAIAATAGAATYALGNSVAIVPALIIVAGGLAGTWVGTTWIHRVTDQRLQSAFAVLLILAAIRLAWPSSGPDETTLTDMSVIVAIGYFACGSAMGILSSMMGVGGGIILIPLLVGIFGFSQHDAAGTSLVVMVPIALFGAIRHSRSGFTDWGMGLRLGIGAFFGAIAGAAVALRIEGPVLRLAFAALVLYTAIQMLVVARRSKVTA